MTIQRRRRLFRVVFAVLGSGFVVAALISSWEATRAVTMPGLSTLLIALAGVIVGLIGAAVSWATLLGFTNRSRGVRAFYLAQIGKYIPGGGVWQALGQVEMSAGPNLSYPTAATAFAIHSLVQLTAGATVGAGLALFAQVPIWLRVVATFGVFSPVLLHRSWMARAVDFVVRRLRREEFAIELPGQDLIVRSYLWSVAPIIGSGLSFALVADSLGVDAPFLLLLCAFAFSWAVGFAAVPFPSGLGVREAALLAVGGAGSAVILTASVVQRAIALTGEVVLAVVSRGVRS
jgi:uncharacterized membrane protein YbhN (UPF0104 family)